MRFIFALLLFIPTSAFADIVVGSPTSEWSPFIWSMAGQADYFDDQQTGLPEGDLVGNDLVGMSSSEPLAYYAYDGTNWGFRVRVGAPTPIMATFDHVLLFGYDSNLDGALDGFFGVDNSGSPDRLRFWDTGAGDQTTPNTTDLGAVAIEYMQDANNYSFMEVNSVNDPGATDFDIDNDGNNDYFISFLLPDADMPFGAFDPVAFMVATSTQPNSINQDIGGLDGGLDSTDPWTTNGGFTDPITGIPEPSSIFLMGIAVVGGLYFMRRRKMA